MAVEKVIKRNFKAPRILHSPLFFIAKLVLGMGLLLGMWPIINLASEKAFSAIVSDFKKRGLLAEAE